VIWCFHLLRPHQVLEPDVHAEHADDVALIVGDGRRYGDAEGAGDLRGVEVRDEALPVLHGIDEPGAVREVVAESGGLEFRLVLDVRDVSRDLFALRVHHVGELDVGILLLELLHHRLLLR